MTLEPQAISRRGLLAGVPGLTGIPLMTQASSALAHDATPEPDEPVQLLFVQVAESGVAEPIPDQSGQFVLTLVNGSGQTLYFSDRPERLAGVVDTSIFLDALVSLAGDPPNAALAFHWNDEDSPIRVAAIELAEPSTTGESIRYRARIIEPTTPGALSSDDPTVVVDELPESFGQATLFIDGAREIGGVILPSGTSTHFPVPPN